MATLTSTRHGHHPTNRSRVPRDRRSILAGSRAAARLQGVQRKGSGWAHRQISSTHVWASCLHPRAQPFQTEMRAMAALHSARKVRPLELGARGWGWGSPEGAALGPQSRDLRANKCLPASRAAAPAAGGPLLPETRAARPAPAWTPIAREGRVPRATLRPYRPGDPGIARPGGSSTRALL